MTLHRLRGVLGGVDTVLLGEEGLLQLHPAVYARSDVGLQAVALAQAATLASGPLRLEGLQAASEAASGEYLPQIEAAWVQPERQRLQGLQQRLRLELAHEQCAGRQCACSLQTLQAALEQEPLLDEREHQRLMTCLAAQGGAAAALAHYRHYVRYLRSEVDDTPLPETRALAEALHCGPVACRWGQEAGEAGKK